MAESIAAFPASTLIPWVGSAGLGCLGKERMNPSPNRSCSPFTAKRPRLSCPHSGCVEPCPGWRQMPSGGAGAEDEEEAAGEPGKGEAGIMQCRLRAPYSICVIPAPPAARPADVLRSPGGISPFWRMSLHV